MRLSRDTRPMWLGTRGWTEKVQVPQPVNRRLLASPQGTSLDFTRQQHSLPPPVGWMMRLITLKVPRHMRTVTPRRSNLLPRKMRVCTSPVTSRRLYQTILFCRSRWPVPLQVQEMNSRRCFTCNRPGHLTWDHQEWEEKNGIRPLQSRGLL